MNCLEKQMRIKTIDEDDEDAAKRVNNNIVIVVSVVEDVSVADGIRKDKFISVEEADNSKVTT